jgi:hypothetical protein
LILIFKDWPQKIEKDERNMDTLTLTKKELITLLQESEFEHLSRSEQVRLRDYFEQILITLQETTDRHRGRRPERYRQMV